MPGSPSPPTTNFSTSPTPSAITAPAASRPSPSVPAARYLPFQVRPFQHPSAQAESPHNHIRRWEVSLLLHVRVFAVDVQTIAANGALTDLGSFFTGFRSLRLRHGHRQLPSPVLQPVVKVDLSSTTNGGTCSLEARGVGCPTQALWLVWGLFRPE